MLKLKITVTKIKISMNGLNSIIEGTEERINDLGDGTIRITQFEQQKEINWKKNEQSLRDLSLIKGCLSLIYLESQKKRKRVRLKKNSKILWPKKSPNLEEDETTD